MIAWIWILAAPLFLGQGALWLARMGGKAVGRAVGVGPYAGGKAERPGLGDVLAVGICIEVGLACAAHLCGVFLGFSLDGVTAIWGVAVLAVCLMSGGAFLVRRLRLRKDKFQRKAYEKEKLRKAMTREEYSGLQQWLCILFALSAILQVVLIATGQTAVRDGDMTVETVQAFLRENGIYRSNPLTGRPYGLGQPLRLKILCLPTLYAVLCRLSGAAPLQLVERMAPAALLAASYCVYARLGDLLFYGDRTKKWIFMAFVNLMVWLGGSLPVLDGFQLLHCGWQGTAVRAGILVPYTIDSCLRGKWHRALLCILAEACLVWTLYGLGVCFFITALFGAIHLGRGLKRKRRGDGDERASF